MERNHLYKSVLAVLATGTMAFVIFAGCNGSSGTGNGPKDNHYRLRGVLVNDLNTDMTYTSVLFTRNDSTLTDGTIIVDGDTLTVTGGVYTHSKNHSSTTTSTLVDYEATDSTFFNETVTSIVPADFSIDYSATVPGTRQKFANDRVRLNWFGSAGTLGYIIAAVKTVEAYTGAGYSQYVTSGATSETFNDSAFVKYTLQGEEPDTGWYYIYVYAFSGSPDSALSSTILPVPLPSQLSDNIDEKDFTGRVGSVVVTEYDSMRVIAE